MQSLYTAQEGAYGRLYYENKLPVLEINSQDPYTAGYTHGHLVAGQIDALFQNYMLPLLSRLDAAPSSCCEGLSYTLSAPNSWSWYLGQYVAPWLLYQTGLNKGGAYKRLLNRAEMLDIPENYRLEMKGIADGCKAAKKESQISYNDILVSHLFLDSYKLGGFGCSAVALRHESRSFLARTLDWFDLNDAEVGKYSLCLRQTTATHRFISIGFPGMIGALSGMNDAGLSLAVCEAGRSVNKTGMPYNLLVRSSLENRSSLKGLSCHLQEHISASSLNLTAADDKNVITYQINPEGAIPLAEIAPTKKKVIATNHFTDKETGKPLPDSFACASTVERYDKLSHWTNALPFIRRHPTCELKDALKAVSMSDTIQAIIMEPHDRRMHVAIAASSAAKKGTYSTIRV